MRKQGGPHSFMKQNEKFYKKMKKNEKNKLSVKFLEKNRFD